MISSMSIAIFTFLGVPPKTTAALAPRLAQAFGLHVTVAPHALALPPSSFYADREQWLARHLLAEVATAPAPAAAAVARDGQPEVRLGIAAHDLFATGASWKVPWGCL